MAINGKSIASTMACCVVTDRELDYHKLYGSGEDLPDDRGSSRISIALTTTADKHYWKTD